MGTNALYSYTRGHSFFLSCAFLCAYLSLPPPPLFLPSRSSRLSYIFCLFPLSLAFSLFLSLHAFLSAFRLEYNTAGKAGGALYYDSCSKLEKACFVQGVGPLSGSRAVLVRNNRARAGGAVFVECTNVGAVCAEVFSEDNKIGVLPQLPKVEFSGNAASSYGNNIATKATTMLNHDGGNRSIVELVPGQESLAVTVKLYDSQGGLVKGSEDIIEMVICPISTGTAGAFECPCMTALAPAVRAALEGLGYPLGYGQHGCKTHDDGLAISGCESGVQNLPSFCKSPWCYVDADKCPVNVDRCESAGGTVGSKVSPFCRSQTMTPSIVLADELKVYYSYATCGAVDTYAPNDVIGEEEELGTCTVMSATQPPTIQGFNSRTGLSNIQAPVECGLEDGRPTNLMTFQIRVLGADHISLVHIFIESITFRK